MDTKVVLAGSTSVRVGLVRSGPLLVTVNVMLPPALAEPEATVPVTARSYWT